MTIRELINHLDGYGLIITDEDLMAEPLGEIGMDLDTHIVKEGSDVRERD